MYYQNWWSKNKWCWIFRFSHANYNLIECTSEYSETTGSPWFYSKGEATDFNADIPSTNNFKSFMYNPNLLENTEAHSPNAIL